MSSFVFELRKTDNTKRSNAGGKAANLGELTKIEGILVPDGFFISTRAFKRIVFETPSVCKLLDQLSLLKTEDRDKIRELSREVRSVIEVSAIPEDLQEEVTHHLSRLGIHNAWAVRSSATAEDVPTASFAGQQDTYLNIIGSNEILKHISKCWASLFTERAVIYRLQNGFDHRKVHLAVVVQKMVFPEVSGIMFTADPVSGNRKVTSIDASFGLGEALVSGLVNADNYRVHDGKIIDKKVSAKKLAVYALESGGSTEQTIESEQQNRQALTDEQILQLERTGRKIEEHFGCPQDIEWCMADGKFYIVQSRPITTLYPTPARPANDTENHVYISAGHQQMMTAPMKPLGISMWQLMAGRPMFEGGGRLFVDVANEMASPAGREILLKNMGQHDPLIKDALMTIIERGDFIKPSSDDQQGTTSGKNGVSPLAAPVQVENDPSIVSDLIRNSQEAIENLKRNIQTKSGRELFDFIREDIGQRKSLSDPRSLGVIMAAITASFWINEKMNEWLGEQNVADTLSQSVPNNVTSEMGLALLELADVIRPYPEVIECLSRHIGTDDLDFLDELTRFEGGQEVRDAIGAFLDRYGMRCAGEIDITRARWSEKPTIIIPLILSNIKNFKPGAGKRKFEQGWQEALKKEQDLMNRLKQIPNGKEKAEQARQKISLIRNFSGYREYPKYAIVSRYFVYKQALLKEVEKLIQAGVIREKEDIYYLTFDEFRDAAVTHKVDYRTIDRRKIEYRQYKKLTPPRVITSDGEIVTGQYNRENLPDNAIAGLPVSSGVVEGRARIISKMEEADLQKGDILVTTFTDPSWTPLFLSIKGLVTEVGGLMTHGAVIAREYGLPAIVGVENATRIIKDGQRIRINGSEGYVELL